MEKEDWMCCEECKAMKGARESPFSPVEVLPGTINTLIQKPVGAVHGLPVAVPILEKKIVSIKKPPLNEARFVLLVGDKQHSFLAQAHPRLNTDYYTDKLAKFNIISITCAKMSRIRDTPVFTIWDFDLVNYDKYMLGNPTMIQLPVRLSTGFISSFMTDCVIGCPKTAVNATLQVINFFKHKDYWRL